MATKKKAKKEVPIEVALELLADAAQVYIDTPDKAGDGPAGWAAAGDAQGELESAIRIARKYLRRART